MSWLLTFGVLGVVIAAAASIVVHANRRRFAARVASEMRALLGIAPSGAARPADRELPPVVERYRQLAVAGHPPVRTVWLRHGGTFQLSPTSRPRPIRGVQLFTADPPGFVWQGRVKLAPGMWIDARDMLASGAGSMRVLLDDTLSLADARGPKLDQGSALRLLAEMVWYPTALFDPRTVTWTAVDTSHARATLQVGDLSVDGTFEFGADGLPIGMTAERFGDKGVLRPWGGVYRDWRTVAGMRVPFEAVVSWQLDPVYTYAHWYVDSIEYDAPGGAGLER